MRKLFNEESRKIGILVFMFILLVSASLISSDALAYDFDGAGSCNCTTCDDCELAIADNTNCLVSVNLTADITDYAGTCIDNPVNFSNKVFDCQGNTIDEVDSVDSYGIYLNAKAYNTIRNCTITDFYYGIYLYNLSDNNSISNNTANSNSVGVFLYYYSNNNNISNNTANDNTDSGFWIDTSSNNTLINNTANSNYDGINLYASSNNTLTNNTANSNYDGIYLASSSNNTLTNNTANSNSHNGLTPSNDNIININNICSNANIDIYAYSSTSTGDNNTCDTTYNWNDTGTTGCTYTCTTISANLLIRNCTVIENEFGVVFTNKDNITINASEITDNELYGIYSGNSNFTMYDSTVCSNGFDIYSTTINTGYNNSCGTVFNWNDIGFAECSLYCFFYEGVCLGAILTTGVYPTNVNVNITDTCKCGHTNAFIPQGQQRICGAGNSWGDYNLTLNDASTPFNGNMFPMQLLNYYMARGFSVVYYFLLLTLGIYIRYRLGR